ncbi:MAG: molybdopterin molybdotransferase MoeA [Phycisphaerae bacterium]
MEFETLEAATPDQVWEILCGHVQAGRQRELPVEETIGCVLACDARSVHDFPPFDRAVMDGHAVRVADFEKGKTRLRNVGLVRAGAEGLGPLEAGTCIQINTGAAVPPGADAVVMVEKSRETGNGFVEFEDEPDLEQFIDRQASLIKVNDLLVRAGTRISAGTLAALVAGGVKRVTVFARPRVAQLSTGDELVEQGKELKESQIHDSNSIALEELIRQAGGETVMVGRCPDDPSALRASLELGLANDLLCITGGMSKGTHDLVPGLLEELGVRWLVVGAHLKPGKPMRIGRSESGCWVVGLPGNPVSCTVCFLLFARGLLEGLQGLPMGKPPHVAGSLEADLPANSERPMYQPAEWSAAPSGEVRVSPLVWRGSGDPFGMASANALIYRAGNAPAAPRGETVHFIPLDLPR